MSFAINHMGKRVVFDTSAIKHKYLRKCADKAIEKLFCHFLPTDNEETIMTFVFTDNMNKHFRQVGEVIMSENARANSNQVFVTGHGNSIGFEFNDTGCLYIVYYELTVPSHVENFANRPKSRAFLSSIEAQVVSFYTRGFLNSLQQANILNGASFLHACSFSIGDNAYVVSATPGAGKSSLLLSFRFASNLDFEFIADDFSAIDKDGHAHQIGRAMAMKSHQLQYFPQLESAVQNMSQVQRLQWFLLKKKGLKYMLAPEELFGDKIASDKKVKNVLFLTNHSKDIIEHEPMGLDEFARLNANMLFSELYLGMEIINHALILPHVHLMDNVGEFIEESRQNIENSLAGCDCVMVKVPFREDPRRVLDYLLCHNLIMQ